MTAETWTEKTRQGEAWTSEAQGTRGFDPAGFDNSPRFDTGRAGGYWPAKAKQAETWTVEP